MNKMQTPVRSWVAVLVIVVSVMSACVPIVGEGESTSGLLRLRAEDAAGNGVPGVGVKIEFPSPPSPDHFTTDAHGRLDTSGPEGTWHLTITPPAGYTMAASQANPFSIKTRRQQEFHVTVRLTRTTP